MQPAVRTRPHRSPPEHADRPHRTACHSAHSTRLRAHDPHLEPSLAAQLRRRATTVRRAAAPGEPAGGDAQRSGQGAAGAVTAAAAADAAPPAAPPAACCRALGALTRCRLRRLGACSAPADSLAAAASCAGAGGMAALSAGGAAAAGAAAGAADVAGMESRVEGQDDRCASSSSPASGWVGWAKTGA